MAFTVDDLPPLDPPTPSTAPAVSISGIPQRSPEDERTFFDLADTFRGLAGSGSKAVYDMYDTGNDFMNLIREHAQEVPTYQEFIDEAPEDSLARYVQTETSFGRFTQDFGSFVVGMIGVGKFTKALGIFGSMKNASKAEVFRKAMVDGAITDFMVMNPEAPRLADLIPEDVRPAVIDYLAWNDGDEPEHVLEGRLKNTLEGAMIGGGVGMFFNMVQKGLKNSKDVAKALSQNAGQYKDHFQAIHGVDVPIKHQHDFAKPSLRHQIDEQFDDLVDSQQAAMRQSQVELTAPLRLKATKELKKASKKSLEQFARTLDETLDSHIYSDANQLGLFLDDLLTITTKAYEKEAKRQAKAGNAAYVDDLRGMIDESVKGLTSSPAAVKTIWKKQGLGVNALAAQVSISKRILQRNEQNLAEIAQRFLKDPTDVKVAGEIFASLENHLASVPVLYSPMSVAGRALRQGRQDAETISVLRKLYPEVNPKRFSTVSDMVEASKKASKNKKELLKLARRFSRDVMGAKGSLPKLERSLMGSNHGVLEKVMQYRIINMLSGPATQVVNFMGIMGRIVIEDVLEGGMAVGFDKTLGRIRFGKVAGVEGVTARGYAARAVGTVDGMGKFLAGFQQTAREAGGWAKAFKNGDMINKSSVEAYTRAQAENLPSMLRMNGNSLMSNVANAYTGLAHSLVFGVMHTTDSFGKSARFYGISRERIVEAAKLKGLEGRAYIDYVSNTTNLLQKYTQDPKRVQTFLKTTMGSEEAAENGLRHIKRLHDEAIEHARAGTFQNPLTGAAKGAEEWLNGPNTSQRLIKMFAAPFFRTPLNIINFTIDRSPGLNLLKKQMRDDIIGKNGREASMRALAKMTMGMTLYTSAAYLVSTGVVTGGHDPHDRAAYKAAGYPEYSIFFPPSGTFVSYNRTDPMGIFLSVVADMRMAGQYMDAGELDKVIHSTLIAASNSVVNKTYMKGMSDLMQVFTDPERFIETYTETQIRTFSPLSGAQRGVDALFERDFEDPPDFIMGDIREAVTSALDVGFKDLPGREMPIQTNLLGQSFERPDGWKFTLMELAGMRPVRPSDSPMLTEMARLKIHPRDSELTLYGDEKMTKEQMRRYRNIFRSDVGAEAHINSMVTSDAYKAMSDLNKDKLLKRMLSSHGAAAKSLLLHEDPVAYQTVMNAKMRELENLQARFDSPPEKTKTKAEEIMEVLETKRPERTGVAP